MLRLIIADLDGVLLFGRYFSDRLGERYGIPRQEIVQIIKETLLASKRNNQPTFPFWKPLIDKWRIPLSEEDFFKLWFEGDLPIPANVDFFLSLQPYVEGVVILSDNFKERTEFIRNNYDFIDMFNEAYFSNEIGFTKDQPESFQYVLSHHEVLPEETLIVDNSDIALTTAASLGIHTHKYTDLSKLSVALRNFDIYL